MPAKSPDDIVTLGEGGTPCLFAKRTADFLGVKNLWIKDESGNPTGSFKARGLSAAVTMARKNGVKSIALPTAGNAGGAAAAYAARAGIACHIFMPADTPRVFKLECENYGAQVTLVDGLIDDCGKLVAKQKDEFGWFDLSTLKEPFRVEGKKTLGYELAEAFDWNLPDVVIYPTGGGTGLIGMWKAFDEMEQLGWIGAKRPRMVVVQADGCAPIIKAFEQHLPTSVRFENAHTKASGLRVPKAYADYIILDILKKSGGTAVAVTDAEMDEGVKILGRHEGIYAAPEGGAALIVVSKMLAAHQLDVAERVVVFNTGTAYKYL
jgi:threonine synthase